MLRKLLIYIVITILIVGCKGVEISTFETAENSVASTHLPKTFTPTRELTLTNQPVSPAVSETPIPTRPSPTNTPLTTPTPTLTPAKPGNYPPEARITSHCLIIAPTMPPEAASNTILVLNSIGAADSGNPETYLLDMADGQFTHIARPNESSAYFVISADRQLMASENLLWNEERTTYQKELVIATSKGERLITLPWEKEWYGLHAWQDDQNLIISYLENDDFTQRVAALLILNPFTDERRWLSPHFPDVFEVAFPGWTGWHDAVYNSTLTRAIYPRTIGNDQELYTYAIWDPLNQQPIASLEGIFTNFTLWYKRSPAPRWSPDGTQFVFESHGIDPDTPISELYRVSQDGQAEQITNLTSVLLLNVSFSWSPDGQKIAFFAKNWQQRPRDSRPMVLDMQTIDILDYCLEVNYSLPLTTYPIWSPDGNQFVVVDWNDDKFHSRVILVDIVQGLAAVVAEDMEPVGWMLPAPK